MSRADGSGVASSGAWPRSAGLTERPRRPRESRALERAAFSHACARCRAPGRRVARSPAARVVHPSVARQLELERASCAAGAECAAGHVHWGREAATAQQGPSALHLQWWRTELELFRRQQPGVPARDGLAKHEILRRGGHEMGMEVSVQARQVGRAVGDNRFISSVEPCEVASARRASILDLHSEDAVLGPSALSLSARLLSLQVVIKGGRGRTRIPFAIEYIRPAPSAALSSRDASAARQHPLSATLVRRQPGA